MIALDMPCYMEDSWEHQSYPQKHGRLYMDEVLLSGVGGCIIVFLSACSRRKQFFFPPTELEPIFLGSSNGVGVYLFREY